MKLDKFKFATLVAYIAGLRPEHEIDLYVLDTLTEINVECDPSQCIAPEKINELLATLCEGKLFEAIKVYRSLTGAGLKEAKDAIERYRNVKPTIKAQVD